MEKQKKEEAKVKYVRAVDKLFRSKIIKSGPQQSRTYDTGAIYIKELILLVVEV